MQKKATEIKRGQALSFRLPSDTPDHLLKQLQKLKETERRNFSSKLAEYVLQGVSTDYSREKETITISLPKTLTKAQRDWLKHEHSEALLGSIVYQLITDPLRATSLLAALNSSSVNIDEALYLQEEVGRIGGAANQANAIQQGGLFPEKQYGSGAGLKEIFPEQPSDSAADFSAAAVEPNDLVDDLGEFDWESALEEQSAASKEEDAEELDADDLLGGFLASMNK